MSGDILMIYIESPCTDPRFNLALEQYVFDDMDRKHSYFMLWQNDNAIIIGKHQNALQEINSDYVRRHNVRVVRRLSGGGAVYHDLGNINYTFITDCGESGEFDFSTFCAPVVRALASLGVEAEVSGRNDIVIGGKKFSGNAQYVKNGRIMHHGAIMFDTDLSAMRQALAAPKDRIDSKGTKSTVSMVTNIKPYLSKSIPVSEFIRILRRFMAAEYNMREHPLTAEDIRAVSEIRSAIYDTWEWNYGRSPECDIIKERRVDGCGTIQIHLNVVDGLIRKIVFFGDYFGNGDTNELCNILVGKRMEETEIRAALAGVDVGYYFHKMDNETLLSIILS